MIKSAYIHIPFCQQICHYCDFTKFFYDEASADAYVDALANEINVNVPGVDQQVNTIFIGGGTPTALNIKQLDALLKTIDRKFHISESMEYTIEANPGDFDEEKIKLLKSYGVNRISLGVQVFDNTMLADLGRIHKVEDVYTTVDQLLKNGFSNISLDLIYALPNQTVEQFEASLKEAIAFNLPHYSTYALQVEPKTVFYNRHKKGQLHRPTHEDEVQMYEILRDTMRSKGLEQYEISNFAKPGYESRHNLTYWDNAYYYGLGAGASGYLPGKRTNNIKPLPAYIKQATADGKPVLQIEKIGLKERVEEEFFLGLRKLSGINKQDFENKFGFSHNLFYEEQIARLIKCGWLVESDTAVHLTDQGVLFGNDVFEAFLIEENEKNKRLIIDKENKI